MKANRFVIPAAAVAMMLAAAVFAMTLTSSMPVIQAHSGAVGSGNIKHVLLLNIDGMTRSRPPSRRGRLLPLSWKRWD